MTNIFMKLAALVCGLLAVLLIIIINLPIAPVNYDVFANYGQYMPGQDSAALSRQDCTQAVDYYDRPEYSLNLYCYPRDGQSKTISVSVNQDGTIRGLYIYLERCAVRAADLMLSTDVQVSIVSPRWRWRRLAWDDGTAYAWVRRGMHYTPYACLYGLYITGE